MRCPYCNQEHPAGSQFCPVTGKKISMLEGCPQCGKPVDPNWLHCIYCGRTLNRAKGTPNQQEEQATGIPRVPITTTGSSKSRTRSLKASRGLIAGGIGGLVIVAVIVFILVELSIPTERIAFASVHDDNYEIYVMNADGSNQIRLTDNPAHDIGFTWSPDGRKIAFTSDRDGNYAIYVMNADGSNQTCLTNNQANNGSPAWSPDGNEIAFASDHDGKAEIYVMNADGSDQTRLTDNPASDYNPTWSR